jgi:hypothetical protein
VSPRSRVRRLDFLGTGARNDLAGASLLVASSCCGSDAAHALRGKTVSAKNQRLASLVVLVMGLLMVSPLAGEV